ncbi:MAG TPA: T9SS type A sorting domain-containing protein [Bacteroidetes bacterium]|nr:T9SS type A sorting domain-containing protein [Bacteroidota bacterium]
MILFIFANKKQKPYYMQPLLKSFFSKKIHLLFLIVLFYSLHKSNNAQEYYQAKVNEEMQIEVKAISSNKNIYLKGNTKSQFSGFPIGAVANPSFKNFRGIALADLNNNGKDEIIFAANSTLFVYADTGLIWQRSLTGTAIYPPAIGDVNGDGMLDIVQVTGGSPANGRIHLFSANGNSHSGWPVNFNNNWIICAPALYDIDDDGKMEIVVCERLTNGKIHILKQDGSSFSANWPKVLDGIPAVTPSIADIDQDGQAEIIAYSTKTKYVFNIDGSNKTGFPITTEPNQKYSYQSPIIADINNNSKGEIIGATHGDSPQYYVTQEDGSNLSNWPKNVPNNSWTYSTPTVVKINGNYCIFMSRPISGTVDDMLYGWDASGNLMPNFPISKSGGLEGIICVADINNDSEYELIFGSNMIDSLGRGFIHAYKMDGSGEVSGFPILTHGWTFMNGPCFGDIDGDGNLDMLVLSYTQNFGAQTDSIFINAYPMNVPINNNTVLWGTYKGNNLRNGDFIGKFDAISTEKNASFSIFPNPTKDFIMISGYEEDLDLLMKIYNLNGAVVMEKSIPSTIKKEVLLNVSALKAGVYVVEIFSKEKQLGNARFVKQ